jgi:predicted NUDIX family phosphoesterase
MDREAAEKNENFKQLIPYCVIKKKLANEDIFLAYQRSKGGGESRLHGNWSVGVGGHINPIDSKGEKPDSLTYVSCVLRELFEELGLLFKMAPNILPGQAIIYDDSDPVGRVHLGVVHVLEIGDHNLKFEDSMANPTWFSKSGIRGDRKFENWSSLVIDKLINK